MKRMESKIALTFAIMFAITFIVNGLYSVVSLGESFFSIGAMIAGMRVALFYLTWIWVDTRRYKLLAAIGVLSITLMTEFVFAELASEDIVNTVNSWMWKGTAMIIVYLIVCVVAVFIADYQADKLLKESIEQVNIELTIKGGIKPEDVEVKLD